MTKKQKLEQLKTDREKVKNGIRFAVHANAMALDYGIYKPYYKTRKAAENLIKRCKANDRRHGWVMFYDIRELYPHEQWFNDLPNGDEYEVVECAEGTRAVLHLAGVKCGAQFYNRALLDKFAAKLAKRGMEFYKFRKEFQGWKLGVRKIVKNH